MWRWRISAKLRYPPFSSPIIYINIRGKNGARMPAILSGQISIRNLDCKVILRCSDVLRNKVKLVTILRQPAPRGVRKECIYLIHKEPWTMNHDFTGKIQSSTPPPHLLVVCGVKLVGTILDDGLISFYFCFSWPKLMQQFYFPSCSSCQSRERLELVACWPLFSEPSHHPSAWECTAASSTWPWTWPGSSWRSSWYLPRKRPSYGRSRGTL